MAFPPEFSSTATYENRYDLDEIDVFLEGNSNNPMYFSVDGISKIFGFGKHYFNFSMLDSSNQDHQLRENSRILFEIKTINNVIIKSDVSEIDQRNGSIVGFFEVLRDPLRTLKEVQDGMATMTIVGSLKNKPTTQNKIPDKFLGAMNYRCTFPIEIRKNILNADSPIVTNTEHRTTSLQGQFSFAKASISPLKTSNLGLTYDKNTGVPDRRLSIGSADKGGSTS